MSVAEVPAPDPFEVEALLGAVGIRAFASKELRQIHDYQADRAAKVRQDIDRKVYRFLQREEPAETADLPDFDYDEVAVLLDSETLPHHVQQQIAAFGGDGDMALAVQVQAMRILAYLKQKLPRRVHVGLTGPEYSRPPEIDITRFARLWAIACDPLSILDDLNEFAVSRDQVTGIADLYPQLYKAIQDAVPQQLTRAKSVDPKFYLWRQKETLLRVLVRQEAPNIALGKAIQAVREQQKQQQKPPGPSGPKKKEAGTSAGGESTAGQRVQTG